ncbi:MAG: pilus assembly protein PilM [Patescibacteria group bacterium]
MSFLSNITKHVPVPKRMSFEHAGVDIGINHIRHIFFQKKGEYLHVKNFGVYDIPTVARDQMLSDQAEVLMALKKMQKEFGYKYIEVSLPEDLVYIYTAEVDGADSESIRSQVEFRIEENVPLKVDEAVFDITPVIFIKELNKSLVSVAVVSKRIIQDYVEVFRNANMEVVSFMVQNQALSKALILKDDRDPYCIVAVEKRNIVVSIVSSSIVLYTSTIGQSVFKEDLKLEKSEVLQDLVKEIYKIIVFWLSYIEKNPLYGFKPLKAILLTSTHKDILESDFANMLTRELSLQVTLSDVWTNIAIPKNSVPEIHKKDSYQYATAIGLAMPKI